MANGIYLVQQFSNEGPGTINGFVVIAPSEEAARLTNPVGVDFTTDERGVFRPAVPYWVGREDLVVVTYLGLADPVRDEGLQLVSAFVDPNFP